MTKDDMKFYLQILAATVLSIMAIIVSISQCSISEKQTKLLEIQTIIAEQKIYPKFVIACRFTKAPGERSYTEDKVFIQNTGEIIYGFRCRKAVFLI